jgi:major cell surface glycoprotein (TIGR04216 family)
MKGRIYRTGVILSIFALVGVAGVGAVAAQDGVNSATPVSPSEPATTTNVTVDIDVGPNADEHTIIVTAEAGPESPVQTTLGPINTTPLQGQTGVTRTLTLGLFNDLGTYDINATLVNETDGSTTENTNAGSLTIQPGTTTKGEREMNRPVSAGDGTVVLGPSANRPTVFQGESSIAFYNADTNRFVDTLTSTDEDNRILDVPIGADEETGTYTISGDSGTNGVVVQEPEVTSVEIINLNGEEVSSVTQGNNILVGVDYNYEGVAPLVVKIKDDQGVSVEGQYLLHKPPKDGDRDDLSNNQEDKLNSSGYDRFAVANFDDSGSYNVIAKPKGYDNDGELDDVGSSINKKALDVASDDDAELELEQDTASQGEEVDAEVTSVEDGDHYYVAIDGDDRRDESGSATADSNPFVSAGDTTDTGLTNGYYYAEVEADGTSGLTRIDTEFLDDTSIDVYLYGNGSMNTGFVGDSSFEQDDVSLEISQAQITVDSPGQTYVPGQEVNLNGTVSEGVDDVAVFIRDRDNYFHVTNISVDDDDNTYEETDFDLSEESETDDAGDIVGQPGVYRYGVIDKQDVLAAQNDNDSDTDHAFVGTDDETDAGLTSSDFSSGASVQQSLRVAEPSLEGAIETYNGEVFADDDVDITGTLIGPREFVTLFTDSRGNTEVNTYNADRDNGEIDEEDITINSLSTGNVRGTILSPGRDTSFGDGILSVTQSDINEISGPGLPLTAGTQAPVSASVDNFTAVANVVGEDRTQAQVTEILLSETVEDDGSDDLIVAEEFRLRDDSSTQIEDVVPSQISDNATGIVDIEVGEEMVVRGTTNRNPDDATIVVEATEGPSLAELGTAVTDEWGYDGEWNVTIDVPESVEPGQYTIQSDDGDRISEANVTVAAEGTFEPGERVGDQLGELRNEIDELQSTVDNLESERNDLEEQVTTLEDENSQLEADLEAAQNDTDTGGADDTNETDDGQGQPGFTAVAALISLIAVALLAIRRQEE